MPRTPSYTLTRLAQRYELSALEAREYNKTVRPEAAEDLYLAGMNSIAQKFWELARADKSRPEEIRLYCDLLLKHFEQKIKKDKIAIMGRHLALLEAKAKALAEAARDPNVSNAQLADRVRKIFYPEGSGSSNGNGHQNGQRLLQNGVTS